MSKHSEENKANALELYMQLGSARKVSEATGIARRTIDSWADKYAPQISGRLDSFKTYKRPTPKKIQRYICTSAQNNTKINSPVWENILALAEHYKAEILVSRFAYNKGAFQPEKNADGLWYAPEIEPYICDDRIHLAPGLDFCGEMNILPTATNPLSGLYAYTGRSSGIFPHAKIAMESVASGKYEATKFNYTTGTVTQRNYIAKKAGQKAEFHHAYGALLVEVDKDGDWFCRQLNADKKGTIHDLRIKVEGGKVKAGSVEAVTWGDIHTARLDDNMRSIAWGKKGILSTLHPRFQFFHDLVDFRNRNHHNRDFMSRFERWEEKQEEVKEEMTEVVTFLKYAARKWCKSIVVDSNHDNALVKWLNETDFKQDPVNSEFYLETMLKWVREVGNDDFHIVEWVLKSHGAPPCTRFLREDESYVVKDVEMGMHGDRGPNGSRGSAVGFAKMGRKCNVGHSHQAGIKDGVYTAGYSAEQDMGYNKGPSSWSHSFIITFENGKRQIITVWNGKFQGSK